MSWVSDGSSPWSGESGKTGIIPLAYGIIRTDKYVKCHLVHTSLEIVSLETVNKVWQTCEANRCLTRVSYLPKIVINNQFTNFKILSNSRTSQTINENPPHKIVHRIHHSLQDYRAIWVRRKLFFLAMHFI